MSDPSFLLSGTLIWSGANRTALARSGSLRLFSNYCEFEYDDFMTASTV